MQKLLRIDGHGAATLSGPDAAPWQARAVAMFRRLQTAAPRWAMRYRTRRALGELEAHRLADIGKTTEEARRECTKPFWQA